MSSQRRMRDVDHNPCLEETDASTKCMDDNNYEKEFCGFYFNRYKKCRKYWHAIMIQRRQDSVEPAMPTAEERKQILASLEVPPY
ncbi:coiled-coil-helix-coiled-coil-helix domain-containing protein 7 [Eleutherodactylus coqui]|uniref:Coiled-coil-helix-coiled-coil-helix domain-containing protein 7 n=1 Tax=Eleutherodactylus coqui TaxID=57060 RepID=A0A8J6F0M3_ELECQ|nr:hypothetical protein GDO78_012467 [Eleutherodactylus coqui]